MSEIAGRFGKVVRDLRLRRKLSQEGLAELANINRNYLSEVERGVVVPSIETAHKIAQALGEPLSHLLHRCENHE